MLLRFALPAALVAAMLTAVAVPAAAAPAVSMSAAATPAATTSTAADPIEVTDTTFADSPQVEVSGTLQIVEAEESHNDAETAEHGDEHFTFLLTDSGERFQITGDLPDEAVSGSTLEGTLALSKNVRAELEVTPEVAAAASTTPLNEGDPASQEILAAATSEQVAMPVAAATIDPPATAAASAAAGTHELYIAVVQPKGSSASQKAFTDAKVRALVSKVSSYWKGQSRGLVTGIVVAKIVRYSSSTSCADGSSSVQKWWTEAAAKFTDKPNTFFSGTTSRHLVVMTPDGSKGPGKCSAGLGFTGLGTVGQGSNSGGYIHTTVGSSIAGATLAHEFGHNMSLRHANVAACASTTVAEGDSAKCGADAYLDLYDVMGAAVVGQTTIPALSLPAKERLGFVESGDIATAALASGETTASFTQVLKPIAAGSGARGVHVTDPVSGEVYWVEYRTASGADRGLRANKDSFSMCARGCGSGFSYTYGDGVRVLKQESKRTETLALAITPQSSSAASKKRTLALDTLESFSSASGGVNVEVNWTTSSYASVTVTLAATPTLVASERGMTLTGSVGVGKTVTAVGQFFGQVGVARSFQWLRNGEPISGATRSTYRFSRVDVATSVSVEVTGTMKGSTDATVVSYGVTVPRSGSFAASSKQPATTILARASDDPALKATVLVFNGSGATAGSAALRWTAPVARTVGVKRYDGNGIATITVPWTIGAGKQTVVARATGRPASNALSFTLARQTPKLSLSLGSTSAKTQSTVAAAVTFTAVSGKLPSGTIEIYDGDELVGSKKISGKRVALTIPASSAGTKNLRAVYSGDTQFLPSDSATKTLKVS